MTDNDPKLNDHALEHEAILAITELIHRLGYLWVQHTGKSKPDTFVLPLWAKVALEMEGVRPFKLAGMKIEWR